MLQFSRRFNKFCLSYFFLFLALDVKASTAFLMRSLSDSSQKSFQFSQLKPSLFIIFQSDCTACKKQILTLTCLDKKTPVYLLGAFQPEITLRKEYKTWQPPFPAYYADQKVLQIFAIQDKLTPQIFIYRKEKLFKLIGLQKCHTIKKHLSGENNV